MENKSVKILSIALIIASLCLFLACSNSETKSHDTSIKPLEKNEISQMVRQEIRYTIIIKTPSPEYGAKSLVAILARLKIVEFGKLEVFAEKDNKLDIPRTQYKNFINSLQRLGKLKVERKYFDTNTPSDSPMPFVIRFELAKSK